MYKAVTTTARVFVYLCVCDICSNVCPKQSKAKELFYVRACRLRAYAYKIENTEAFAQNMGLDVCVIVNKLQAIYLVNTSHKMFASTCTSVCVFVCVCGAHIL